MNPPQFISNRLSICVILIWLIGATLAVYGQVYRHAYVNIDDGYYITHNRFVKQGVTIESLKWAVGAFHASNWHPLTWLSHMADISLFGLNPGAHHLHNVMLHLLNTLLLFLLLIKTTRAPWKSGLVASFFALHPLHVESVAWVSERKDVLCTFLMFLTLIFYLKYVKSSNRRNYSLIILCYSLSLLAKPLAVTLPCLLLLFDYWPLKRIQNIKKILIEKIPLFILAFFSSTITYLAQQEGGSVSSFAAFPLRQRILNALVSYVVYLQKTFLPFKLTFFYPMPENISLVKGLLALLFLSSATFICIKLRKKGPFLIMGWLWYLGTLVPMIGIIQVGAQSMADRYSYIPLIGIFIMAIWSSELASPIKILKYSYITILLALTVIITPFTFQQIGYWTNNYTLLSHALEVRPNDPGLHNDLGNTLAERGDLSKAVHHFKIAHQLNQKDPSILVNWGVALAKGKRYDEGRILFEKAIRLDPNYSDALYNLGKIYHLNGNFKEAKRRYLKALDLAPDHVAVLNNLSALLYNEGEYVSALNVFRRILKIEPDNAAAHHNIKAINSLIKKNGSTPTEMK